MNKKSFIALAILLIAIAFVVPTVLASPSACNDKTDNDGDGLVDLDDPGCSSKQDKSELNPAIECDDGIDNDGDGAIDNNDAGCSGPTDNDESNCGDGVCEGEETQQNCAFDCGYPDSCTDTDGGNTITIFGTVYGYFNDAPYSHDDYCVDYKNIMEYYCNGDYETSQQQSCGTDGYGANYCIGVDVYQDYTDYSCILGACSSMSTPVLVETCQYGCSNGLCNPMPDSCTDTDGGFNIYLQGIVSGYLNENPYNYTDFCNSTFVLEYYCSGNQPRIYPYDCALNDTVCIDGECV